MTKQELLMKIIDLPDDKKVLVNNFGVPTEISDIYEGSDYIVIEPTN